MKESKLLPLRCQAEKPIDYDEATTWGSLSDVPVDTCFDLSKKKDLDLFKQLHPVFIDIEPPKNNYLGVFKTANSGFGVYAKQYLEENVDLCFYSGHILKQQRKNGQIPNFDVRPLVKEFKKRLTAGEDRELTKEEKAQVAKHREELQKIYGTYAFIVSRSKSQIYTIVGHQKAGIANIVNCSRHNHANIIAKGEENHTIQLKTLREIKQGQEIFLDYDAEYTNSDEFEDMHPIGILTIPEFVELYKEYYTNPAVLLSEKEKELLNTEASHVLVPNIYQKISKVSDKYLYDLLFLIEGHLSKKGDFEPIPKLKHQFITIFMYACLKKNEEAIKEMLGSETCITWRTKNKRSAWYIVTAYNEGNSSLTKTCRSLAVALKEYYTERKWSAAKYKKYIKNNLKKYSTEQDEIVVSTVCSIENSKHSSGSRKTPPSHKNKSITELKSHKKNETTRRKKRKVPARKDSHQRKEKSVSLNSTFTDEAESKESAFDKKIKNNSLIYQALNEEAKPVNLDKPISTPIHSNNTDSSIFSDSSSAHSLEQKQISNESQMEEIESRALIIQARQGNNLPLLAKAKELFDKGQSFFPKAKQLYDCVLEFNPYDHVLKRNISIILYDNGFNRRENLLQEGNRMLSAGYIICALTYFKLSLIQFKEFKDFALILDIAEKLMDSNCIKQAIFYYDVARSFSPKEVSDALARRNYFDDEKKSPRVSTRPEKTDFAKQLFDSYKFYPALDAYVQEIVDSELNTFGTIMLKNKAEKLREYGLYTIALDYCFAARMLHPNTTGLTQLIFDLIQRNFSITKEIPPASDAKKESICLTPTSPIFDTNSMLDKKNDSAPNKKRKQEEDIKELKQNPEKKRQPSPTSGLISSAPKACFFSPPLINSSLSQLDSPKYKTDLIQAPKVSTDPS